MGFFQKLFGGQDHGGKLIKLHEALENDLQLDATQTQQMRDVFQNFRQQRKEINASGRDRVRIEEAREQLRNNICGILNDEQNKIFTANAAKYDAILQGGNE